MVSVIGGPPSPYQVDLESPRNDDSAPWPYVQHSCMWNSGEYANPGVRLAALATQMNGIYTSVCAASFGPALMQAADAVGKVPRPVCLEGVAIDAQGQADCTVTELETRVPSCAASGSVPPCWELTEDPMSCPGARVLSIVRPPGSRLPTSVNLEVSCAVTSRQ